MKHKIDTTKINIFLLLLVFLASIGLSSCRKLEEYPPEPTIAFNNFVLLLNTETGISEKGILSISYQDGDGNIGLDQSDTTFPYQIGGDYYYNLVITYFEQQHGIFVEMPVDFSARVPKLLPGNIERGIKGIIENEMFIYDPTSEFDTIQFKVKLIDRKLNISNEITTPPIVRIVP